MESGNRHKHWGCEPIKHRFYCGYTGSNGAEGYIFLTEEEAEIVRRVTNPRNWDNAKNNPWTERFMLVGEEDE